MASETLSRPGSNLGDHTAENANFLKLFAGEVLSTFAEQNKLMPLTRVRTISGGKSATFPVIGTASAKWHTAGESVISDTDADTSPYLSDVKSTEKEIFIDDPLVSGVLHADIDRLKNHWDERSEYSSAIARALAKEADIHIMATIMGAGLAANSITAASASSEGRVFTISGGDATVGSKLVEAAFSATETMDNLDVPREDRVMLVRPKQFYKLAQETSLINKDFVESNGDYSKGTVFSVAGFQVVMTNNMPVADLSSTSTGMSGAKNDPMGGGGVGYNGGWDSVGCLFFQKQAVGTVKLADLTVGTDYHLDRLATLILAQYAMGHGVLRPECAIKCEASTI